MNRAMKGQAGVSVNPRARTVPFSRPIGGEPDDLPGEENLVAVLLLNVADGNVVGPAGLDSTGRHQRLPSPAAGLTTNVS